jgi:hypothetical protein
MRRALIMLAALAALGRSAMPDARDLDLGHWANTTLERLRAMGCLELPATKPYPRDLVRAEVLSLGERAARERLSFSRADSLALEKLRQELGLVHRRGRAVEGDMLVLGDQTFYLCGDGRARLSALGRHGREPEYAFRGDLELYGGHEGRFVFDQRLAFELERERQKVERLSGSQTTWRGGSYSVDWAYLRLRLLDPRPESQGALLELTAGRQQHWWGRGRQGTLLLSDNAPSFDALGARLYYKKIGFESFAGVLGTEQRRFFSGHRGTLDLPWGLSLGASEVVLYQAANLDPAYLNPLLPFYGNQWNQRDDDNILWSADLGWRARPGLYLYGELLMDDVQYEQDPPAPQKLGFLAGLHWADPLGLADCDLKTEWAGNQKWVYTQRRHANRYLGMDTVSCLGHWMGTDADMAGIFLEHRLHPRLNAGLGYSWTRQGEGSIDRGLHYAGEPYQGGAVAPGDTSGGVYVGDDMRTAFLSGTVERTDLGHCYLAWEPSFWISLHARCWAGYSRNAGHLAGAGRRDMGAELKLTMDY